MFNNEQQENPISDIDYGVIQDKEGNHIAIEFDPANAKYKILQYLSLLKLHALDNTTYDANKLGQLFNNNKIKDNAPKYSDYSGSSDDFGYVQRMRENDILVYLIAFFNDKAVFGREGINILDLNPRECKVKSLFANTITKDNNGSITITFDGNMSNTVDNVIKYLKNTLYTNDPFVQKILSDLENKNANYIENHVLEAIKNVANTQKELHSDKFCDIEYVNIDDYNNNKVNTPVHIDFNNNNFFSNLEFNRIESNEIEGITDACIKFKKDNKHYYFLREVGAIIQSNVEIPTDTADEDVIKHINEQKDEFQVFFNNRWHPAEAIRRDNINDFINCPDVKQATISTKDDVLIVVDDNFTGERNIIDFKSNGVISIKDKHKQTFDKLAKYAKDEIKYLTELSKKIKTAIDNDITTNSLEDIFCWNSTQKLLLEDSQPHEKLEAIYDLFDNLDDKSTGIKDTLEYKFIKKYLELLKDQAKLLYDASQIIKSRNNRNDKTKNTKKTIIVEKKHFQDFMEFLNYFLDIIETGNLSKFNNTNFINAGLNIHHLIEAFGKSYTITQYTNYLNAIKSTAYAKENKEKLDISIKQWDKSGTDGTLQEKKSEFKSDTIGLFGGAVAQDFKLIEQDKVYNDNNKATLLKSVLEEFDNSNVVEENDLAKDYKDEKEAQKQEEEERKKQEEYEKTPQGKKEMKKRQKEEAKREKEMQKIAEKNIKNQAKQQIDKALNDLQNIQEYKWWMAIVNFFNDIFGLKTHYKTDNENKSIYSNALAMLKNLPISLDQSAITSINNELQEAYNKIADNNMDRCYQLEYKGINNDVKNNLKNAKKTEKSIS